MKTKTESILTTMNVLSWIVFIGLLIQLGATLVSYFVSIINPEMTKKLYMGLNLYAVIKLDFWQYSVIAFLMIALSALKAYTAYLVIQILSKINLQNPFTIHIALLIEKVSIVIFIIWAVSMIINAFHQWLNQNGLPFPENWISGEFIFLAGVIFIIAQVFKKGIEIQSENDLTI